MKEREGSKKNYNHFSDIEREILALMLVEGRNQKEIAKELNRDPATISREINRNGSGCRRRYLPSLASQRAEKRKKQSHIKDRLKNPEIRRYVIEKLKAEWTPEQIAGRLPIDMPGQKTNYESIYLFIFKDARHLIKYLARGHRKRLKRTGNKGKRAPKIPDRISIDFRPDEINNRSRAGDWEADTIVSRKSKTSLLVLRERLTQFTIIAKLKDRTAETTNRAIIKSFENIPENLRKSITYDNGSEFSLHSEVAADLNLETYFCNPYHSWEKGSVENTNGLIRRIHPKKTDFSLISESDIELLQTKLNQRPRKSLKFLTPFEALKRCA